MWLVAMVTAEEDKWAEIRKAGDENQATYDRLWKKAGFDAPGVRWTVKGLEAKLELWEFQFVMVSMFDGVANNGGLIHGLHCFFDEEPESDLYIEHSKMLEAWKATGCDYLIKAYGIGKKELKRYGVRKYELLSGEQEEELEETLDEAHDDLEIKGEPFEVKLSQFAQARQKAPSSRDDE